MRRMFIGLSIAAGLVVAASAQSKPPVSRTDYGQWESLSPAAARGGLSPDGQWLAFTITRANRTSDLVLKRLADGVTRTIASGTQATFSADSRWAAYSIGYTEAEQERMRAERRPIQNKLGLADLRSADTSTLDGIQSFTFSPTGAFLAMRRYAPAPATTPAGGAPPAPAGRGGAAGAPAETEPLGVTVIVRDLASGRDWTFGNVGELAWQDAPAGRLLAMAISADGQAGNGVHLFDPSTGVLRVLESATAGFSSLAWRKDTADLAYLRSKTDDRRDGPTEIAVAWRGLAMSAERRVEFDPTSAEGFPAGMRTVTYRRPSWSDRGTVLFLGIARWEEKPPAPTGRGRGAGATPGGTQTPPQEADEPAGLDIWHWKDIDVQPRQKLSAAADRRRSLLGAWHVDTGRFVQIGNSFNEQVQPIRGADLAYIEDWSAYAMDRTIGRPAADLYLADLATGARTRIKERVDDRYAGPSPSGRYILFLEADHMWTIDVATRAVRNITRAAPTSFIDKESDATIRQKPAFGVAGWTKDDASVVLNDRFDLWEIAADGSRATRLTDGAAEQVRHRVLRLDPEAEHIDWQKPQYVSLFGLWSKKAGYGRIAAAADGAKRTVERLIWLDKTVSGLARAKDADVFDYSIQGHDDSPDLFVGGPDLSGARQVTSTNLFQDKFAWSRSEVIEYKTDKGLRLQGALYYPAGYEAGRRYPMVVYLYERLSDGVHRYVPPSDRDYYNTTVFTSQGYFVLQSDIVFRPREPGLSVVECVTPAVRRVAAMGVIDPARVGVVGHSWGGFDASFLATHTTNLFAASVAGAPITNLVSNYGNHHWSSGIAETDHIETGQQRMEVPLWEDFQAYVRNSAVFNVQHMTTPLMLMTGDSDGTVFWHQAVELYNIARRARKNVVLLVYNGEDHGLRQKKNQVDYQRRILEWFGHYLKGEEPPAWIVNGQSFLDRDAEVRQQTIRRSP